MDVDGDVDSQLLQQFSSMGTTDKEVLIAEFQRLLGNQISDAGCAFFLDMNNWNLQAAICSYFEYDQPSFRCPQMSFVQDVTIGEGESVTPNTKFTKTWRIQNTGDEAWPNNCNLRFVAGEQFGSHDSVTVHALGPGEITDVSIDMISPSQPGIHQGQWRMCTGLGLYFGEFIWVILQVEEGGILAVTQLLSQFDSGFTSSSSSSVVCGRPQNSTANNPFMRSPLESAGFAATGGDGNLANTDMFLLPTAPGNNVRHSSLPSSPRWLGEERDGTQSTDAVPIPCDQLRARTVLFQTPDNSPSKTLGGNSRPTLQAVTFPSLPTPLLPSNHDLDTMET